MGVLIAKSSKKIARAAFGLQKRAYPRHLDKVISTLFFRHLKGHFCKKKRTDLSAYVYSYILP